MSSPLSQQPPQKIRDLPRDFLRAQLGEYFRAPAPREIVDTDYALWRCSETGLEFCLPLQPGNTAFYNWITRFADYYPGLRWEYGRVSELVRESSRVQGLKILDVGSGKGDFLQTLDFLPAKSRYALDMTESAIKACREKGFCAFEGTIESALAQGFLHTGEFPVVTSFHCLEHVGDPVGFVRGLINITAPGGRVFVSTPVSPMSFEGEWFDALNHPPHHLTRWNLGAYQKLAEILGVSMRHFVPPTSALRQAVQLFKLRNYGPGVNIAPATQLKDLLLKAPQFAADWCKLRARAKRHALGGSDVILVEFTVPH